jgi:hypothetical protein
VSTATCAAIQRLLRGQRVPLGRRHADEERAGQPRTGGDRDRVDVGQRHPGLGQRAVHRRHDRLQVRAAGHLGHHATEPGVHVHTGRQRVGQQGVPAHDPHAGLVA